MKRHHSSQSNTVTGNLPHGDEKYFHSGKKPRRGFLLSLWELDWVKGLLLVVAVILVYQPVWHAQFIWDDDVYVTDNKLLSAPDGLRRIWFSAESPSQYFPLTYTTFWIERLLWGLNATGYHWVNILLHAANALLVWQLVRKLNLPGSWLAAALFALHPVQVESVAWITERKNVLSLFFCLLALLAWIEFVERRFRFSGKYYGLALMLYLLALFSKTTACTLPAALLLILWLKQRPISRARLFQILPFVAIGIGMGLLTVWWERYHQGTAGKLFALNPLERLLIASRAIWFYLGKLIWPAPLAFSYPRWNISTADPWAYFWLVACAGTCVAIYRTRQFFNGAVAVALLFYVATLSPLLGFIMLYTFRFSFVADHYQYAASIGPLTLAAVATTVISRRFAKKKMFSAAFFGTLLLTLGALSWRQAAIYKNPEVLWRDTLAKNPRSWMAFNNLGIELERQWRINEAADCFQKAWEIEPDDAGVNNNLADCLLAKNELDQAIAHYQKAVELQPLDANMHNNLGTAFLRRGQINEAIFELQKSTVLNPDNASAHNNLGTAFRRQGLEDEAAVQYRTALRVQSNFAEAHYNLGNVLLNQGKAAEAMSHYLTALQIQPKFAEAQRNLANLLSQRGQIREAVGHYRQYLELQPDDADICGRLAWILATCSDDEIRDGRQAVGLAEHAARLSQGKDIRILSTLGAAYAADGRFPQAIRSAQEALQIALAQSQKKWAEILNAQIKFYESGTPLRINHQPDVSPN